MYKTLLLVFAVLAVASAQYIASPYSYGAYPAYSGVSAYSAYPAYSGVSTYGAYPYAYSGLGYGSSYLYLSLQRMSDNSRSFHQYVTAGHHNPLES
ncbi:Nuclear pore complex protein Nup214 [Frankliniella fusca]|uniref:Nuclear pore complex protein Nup214 n=1 Tax=Frankliniella fusca TaxID=407009 RepID=A0AAE1HRD1_9NEOP|nr:Nuclear pore complex protein Nup214 [Frankliniella fusca]